MDEDAFQTLLRQIREDPALLGALVLDTERTIEKIDVLTDADKERLKLVDPQNVLRGILAGARADCGVTVSCGETCTHTSSAQDQLDRISAKLSDCGVTVQCGSTCTHTSSLAEPVGRISQLVRQGLRP